jgi:DNA-binding transcriptional MerR regulator
LSFLLVFVLLALASMLPQREGQAGSGYRRYDLAQIPAAQVIRRFRDLNMPLEDIRGVLRATDLDARGELIARHLRRLEQELPPADLAVIAHSGPHDGIDGALAHHVTRHALAVDGPILEFYPVNRHHAGDSSRWRTEIGWPIFETAPR